MALVSIYKNWKQRRLRERLVVLLARHGRKSDSLIEESSKLAKYIESGSDDVLISPRSANPERLDE